MAVVYASIGIENQFSKRKMEIRALVDSDSVLFTIPEHVAMQLGFDIEEVATREVVLADGSRRSVPMVGPLRIYFAEGYCDLSELVLGDEPLFGIVPMEMMDLVLSPELRRLEANPSSPFVPVALAK